MSGGIIALIIVVLALIVLGVFGLTVLKKAAHLIKEINRTTAVAQDKIEFFTNDTNAIKSKIENITNRVDGISVKINHKMKNIDYFSETTTDFQNALDELKKSFEHFFSGFFNFSNKQSNQRTLSISTVKKTIQKLVEKQKMA
ncbi:MAG: DUF948 domain-containing protein [Carnobacterium sp.]|uniref:DUF948 domain-containing protein n=1 Tax=Carnobacterium sp. TaxID=48221 RepID=UPI003C76A80D